ncbi:unnamed protein product [Soboliphyme baturini]|uniref:DET1- and DDB1-associated protein 1 n=1 Tax=Soboliphyme baturini TaxID=241478 RepID=A0A183IWF1_9BILA|nr:unnamed protein product [Soboliphyme baturini]
MSSVRVLKQNIKSSIQSHIVRNRSPQSCHSSATKEEDATRRQRDEDATQNEATERRLSWKGRCRWWWS